jgi:hypothetical protein
MNASNIKEHMEVLGADGKHVGFVDRTDALSIKLTLDSPGARGEHRFIPLDWVARVDEHVHLSKLSGDVREQWQAHPVQQGEYVPSDN